MSTPQAKDVVIIGGGTAGISAAARLAKGGCDVTVVDPASTHYYQPLWTLVGGGLAHADSSSRPMRSVIPRGAHWVQDRAVAVDPDTRTVRLEGGEELGYRTLVVAAGIQLDWDAVPGMVEALRTPAVTSNYRYESAPHTWENIQALRRGTAVFTMPSAPIKCAGAPQKIAYLACDYWRGEGVLGDIDVHLVLPTPGMFGVPHFAKILAETARDYGIAVHLESEVTAIDPAAQTMTISPFGERRGEAEQLHYDLAHVVPRMSAPDWLARGPLADPENPQGYVQVDKHTLQHTRYPDVFGLGDCTTTPNSKTGAAVRKQAPVLAANVLAHRAGRPLTARYDGYASCPLTLSRKTLLLAEFDYDFQMVPSNPLPWPDTRNPVTDFSTFKKIGLPAMYWNGMLKGLV